MVAEPVTARRLGIAAAVAAALLTSACAAGQVSQTAHVKPTLDGVNASVGNIDLRAIAVEPPGGTTPYYPTGSDASMKLVLVNTGRQDDRLLSVTTDAAADWAAFATTADADAVAAADTAHPAAPPAASSSAASSSTSASASATGSSSTSSSASAAATASTSASGSVSASGSATPSALPTPLTSITVPAGGRVSWGVPEAKGALLLVHLTHHVYPGDSFPITFTFADAGSVTVIVPVALSNSPNSSVIPAPPAPTGIGE